MIPRYNDSNKGLLVGTRAAMDVMAGVWTELQNGSCLALPQAEGMRRTLCRQLMGSSAVAWTPEVRIYGVAHNKDLVS